MTTEDLIKQCSEHGYIILNPEDYINTATKNLQVICKDCGKQFVTSRASIYSSKGRCSKCGQVANTRTPEEAAKLIASVNGNILLNPEDYKGNQVGNLKILCGVCGQNVFTTSIGRYFSLNVNRCSSCSNNISKGEIIISEILDELGIKYIYQKRYDDCRDKATLPFDFYLPDFDKIIEFDGQGHFEPVFGEASFMSTRYHDKIKNEYCKNNNIELLRIPFWDTNNAKLMIINFLHLAPYPLIIHYNKSPYQYY